MYAALDYEFVAQEWTSLCGKVYDFIDVQHALDNQCSPVLSLINMEFSVVLLGIVGLSVPSGGEIKSG